MYERINYMKTNFPKLENLAIKVFCTGSLWHYQKLYRQPNIDPAGMYRKRILNSVKRFNRKSIFTQWKLKEILWYQFFMISPNTCVKFRNYINIGI